MRKLAGILIALTILLLGCQSTPPDNAENSSPAPIDSWTDWSNREIFKKGLLPHYQDSVDDLSGASIYHIEYEIADDLVHVTGNQEVLYTNQEDVILDKLKFHLFPNLLGGEMLITELSVDGVSVSSEQTQNDSILSVPLPTPLQPGENILIQIRFVITVPTELESNYGILASTEGVLALAHAYPMISVYDDEGWNTEIPSNQGDVTYADVSFYLVRVSAPDDLVLVTSGNEIHRKSAGDRQIVTFAAGPARDFYLVASSKYVLISEKYEDYTINSYAPANAAEGAQMALDVAAEAIEFFSESYAPYPYTEFDIASTPTYALGIEYPGMTAINIDLYDLSANFGGTPASIYLESTITHEVGHQWFYNFVGNDQLDDPWLDESLTQYITWQYYLDRHGANSGAGFAQALDGRWQRIDREKIPVGLPVTAYQDAEYGAIVYGRGAFFFEALAEKMGEEKFDIFLADYTQSHQWDIATNESLQLMAEEHCKCELSDLFAEWIYPTE